MFNRIVVKRGNKLEGEMPFWISYADLMTACMTMFLVVMAVTIIALRNKYESQTKAEASRIASIKSCSIQLDMVAKTRFHNANVIYNNGDTIQIDLGSIVKFDSGKFLIDQNGQRFIREYIPSVLDTVKSKECSEYFRRVVVEGYTDTDGPYLYNLDLSLKRSKEVICALSKSDNSGKLLSQEQLKDIRDYFLVGGFSFNSQKEAKSDSRRVELKLEFWPLQDKAKNQHFQRNTLEDKRFGTC